MRKLALCDSKCTGGINFLLALLSLKGVVVGRGLFVGGYFITLGFGVNNYI